MIYQIALAGSLTDIEGGVTGGAKAALSPPGTLAPLTKKTFINKKLVGVCGDSVGPHGNFKDLKGKTPNQYNSLCAHAVISQNVVPNVMVEGRMMAVAAAGKYGSICDCTHYIFGPGSTNVFVGSKSGLV